MVKIAEIVMTYGWDEEENRYILLKEVEEHSHRDGREVKDFAVWMDTESKEILKYMVSRELTRKEKMILEYNVNHCYIVTNRLTVGNKKFYTMSRMKYLSYIDKIEKSHKCTKGRVKTLVQYEGTGYNCKDKEEYQKLIDTMIELMEGALVEDMNKRIKNLKNASAMKKYMTIWTD